MLPPMANDDAGSRRQRTAAVVGYAVGVAFALWFFRRLPLASCLLAVAEAHAGPLVLLALKMSVLWRIVIAVIGSLPLWCALLAYRYRAARPSCMAWIVGGMVALWLACGAVSVLFRDEVS